MKLFVVLFICTVIAADITGTWVDSLGNQLYLEVYKEIILDGWYNLNGTVTTYAVNGLIGKPYNGGCSVVGFTVVFQNGVIDSNTVSSWVGIYDGTNTIVGQKICNKCVETEHSKFIRIT